MAVAVVVAQTLMDHLVHPREELVALAAAEMEQGVERQQVLALTMLVAAVAAVPEMEEVL